MKVFIDAFSIFMFEVNKRMKNEYIKSYILSLICFQELDNGGSSSPNREDVLVAPMSDQPTRKALSMASLRRL